MDKYQRFYERYQAESCTGHLRYPRYYRGNLSWDAEPWESSYHTVPSVQITMPEDRFEMLLNIEQRLQGLLDQSRAINRNPIDQLWDEFVKEERIRNEVGAVKIAYDKYLTLLNLARH